MSTSVRDTNPSASLGPPFRHIQRCADVMGAGDTCYGTGARITARAHVPGAGPSPMRPLPPPWQTSGCSYSRNNSPRACRDGAAATAGPFGACSATTQRSPPLLPFGDLVALLIAKLPRTGAVDQPESVVGSCETQPRSRLSASPVRMPDKYAMTMKHAVRSSAASWCTSWWLIGLVCQGTPPTCAVIGVSKVGRVGDG